MNEWLRWLMAGLACYRLAQMVALDDGPGDVFFRLRAWGRWAWLTKLVQCPYCLGVWFAVPLAALVIWPTVAGDMVLVGLSIMGVQAVLESIGGKDGSSGSD